MTNKLCRINLLRVSRLLWWQSIWMTGSRLKWHGAGVSVERRPNQAGPGQARPGWRQNDTTDIERKVHGQPSSAMRRQSASNGWESKFDRKWKRRQIEINERRLAQKLFRASCPKWTTLQVYKTVKRAQCAVMVSLSVWNSLLRPPACESNRAEAAVFFGRQVK